MLTYSQAICAVAISMIWSSVGLADAGHGKQANIGQTGDISHIDQVVSVDMGEMYFDPDQLTFERGETVKFLITNSGRMVHEFSIGTDAKHKSHRREMTAMLRQGLMTRRALYHDKMEDAGMMHLDANARLLEPGETAELIWTFSGDAELELSCNIPGHRAGGMFGGTALEGLHDS